jgi:GNAT superfamily N-acetyltransferase
MKHRVRARTAALRLGVPGDADTLAWVAAVALAAYYGQSLTGRTPRPAAEDVDRWRRRILSPHPAVVFVAELAGEAVGSLALAETLEPATLHLEGFYVVPHLWSRGVGRLLHDALVSHAVDTGTRRVLCEVWDVNPRGRRFHLAAGWTEDGRHRPGPRGSRFVGMELTVETAAD